MVPGIITATENTETLRQSPSQYLVHDQFFTAIFYVEVGGQDRQRDPGDLVQSLQSQDTRASLLAKGKAKKLNMGPTKCGRWCRLAGARV